MRLRKAYAWLGILIGAAGLIIDFWIIMGSAPVTPDGQPANRNFFGQFIYYWSFFTHLSNLAVVLVYGAELTSARWLDWLRHPVGRAAMAGYIGLVMVYFHIALAPLYTFTGGLLVSNYLLHYVAPILYLIWWLWLAPHGTLRLRDVPVMLLPGAAYVVLVMIRGAIVGEYPYPILDVTRNGYAGALTGIAILLGVVAALSVTLVLIDRLMGLRRRAAA